MDERISDGGSRCWLTYDEIQRCTLAYYQGDLPDEGTALRRLARTVFVSRILQALRRMVVAGEMTAERYEAAAQNILERLNKDDA